MVLMTDSPSLSAPQPRRQSPRIPGPFEGRLVGDIAVPVQARDLSTGGCFVEADERVPISRSMRLHIELPGEGWISAQVESVYRLGTQGVAQGNDLRHLLVQAAERVVHGGAVCWKSGLRSSGSVTS